MLPKLVVDLRLGKEAKEEDIIKEKRYEVIVVRGGLRPEIPGIDRPSVAFVLTFDNQYN